MQCNLCKSIHLDWHTNATVIERLTSFSSKDMRLVLFFIRCSEFLTLQDFPYTGGYNYELWSEMEILNFLVYRSSETVHGNVNSTKNNSN